jgi:hypothetical protein
LGFDEVGIVLTERLGAQALPSLPEPVGTELVIKSLTDFPIEKEKIETLKDRGSWTDARLSGT